MLYSAKIEMPVRIASAEGMKLILINLSIGDEPNPKYPTKFEALYANVETPSAVSRPPSAMMFAPQQS